MISGLFWRFAERIGAQLVAFVISIVLARLLDPTVYGTIALVTVFTTIMQVFVDSGLGNALIQKKDADDLDFSSVFYFNVAMCALLYLVMYFVAPLIAAFYDNSELIPIIRVLSLTLVISGVRNVQQAYVSRHMMFRKFFFSTIGGTIGAAFVGIGMAYMGCGVWALVGQQLFNTLVSTAILWFAVPWRPKWMFSLTRLKGLLSFGWKLLVAALIETTYNDLCQLLIGKLYTEADLAYYNQGKKIPYLIAANVNTSIDSVLLSTMSHAQDNRERVKAMTRRAIQTSSYLMAPMMIGLAVCADSVVRLLLTEKWLDCVPFMQIFCITYIFYPIHAANLNAIKAMGHSDVFLKLEVLKKIVGLAAILGTMWISVEAMAYSLLVTTIISSAINAYPNKKLLDYSWFEQMKDILPNIGLALAMAVAVYFIQCLPMSTVGTLFLQVIAGVGIYIVGSMLLRLDAFCYLLMVAKEMLGKKMER